ncbi:WD40-repeat-containing domain protein [Pisolithus tinctorius]|nr:WD40-repeat-containing domain protein [Pisolithus tinctorius]
MNHPIHVYSPATGELLQSLHGHEGGLWILAVSRDILVSGSTDRTARIWDLNTGRCTHVFEGHTSTVRCLAIVRPEVIDVEGEGGVVTREKWPKQSLVVTGSRDHSLRVWAIPRKGADDTDAELTEDVNENPYHKLNLGGHDHAVRALAARGRMPISGSYDCTVRV